MGSRQPGRLRLTIPAEPKGGGYECRSSESNATLGLYLIMVAPCSVRCGRIRDLKYPANPPRVGDPATIGKRTSLYLVMLAISLGACAAAFRVERWLGKCGVARHYRQPAAVSVYIAAIAAAYLLLPPGPEPVTTPAAIVWTTRLISVAGQAVLWGVLAAGFGILSMRAERPSPPLLPWRH